jgi:hypothetical protein
LVEDTKASFRSQEFHRNFGGISFVPKDPKPIERIKGLVWNGGIVDEKHRKL